MARRHENRRGPERRNDVYIGTLRSNEVVWGNPRSKKIHIPENDLRGRSDPLREALSRLDGRGRGRSVESRGYIAEAITLGHYVGVEGVVETTELDVKRGRIVTAFQPGRDDPSRWVLGREGAPTRKVTVVLRRQSDNSSMVTLHSAWIGDKVPRRPVGEHENDELSIGFWLKNALTLSSIDQVDTSRPIILGEAGDDTVINETELQHRLEQHEREFLASKTIERLADPEADFRSRYADLQAKLYTDEIARVDERPAEEARRQAMSQVETYAALCLAHVLRGKGFRLWQFTTTPYIEDYRKQLNKNYGREEGERLTRKGKKLVSLVGMVATGDTRTTLLNYLTRLNLEDIDGDPEYTKAFDEEKAALEEAEEEAKQTAQKEIDDLLAELVDRQNEPKVVEAMSSWTNAPDSEGHIGPGGRGWSGGLEHFFGYRGSGKKEGRFKYIPEPMTVEGFIAFTNRLKQEVDLAEKLIENPTPSAMWACQNYVVVLKDDEKNRRYYIVQPNKENKDKKDLIIAYQKPGQKPKLTTMIPDYSIHYLENTVQASIKHNDGVRINQLGENIEPLFPKGWKKQPKSP